MAGRRIPDQWLTPAWPTERRRLALTPPLLDLPYVVREVAEWCTTAPRRPEPPSAALVGPAGGWPGGPRRRGVGGAVWPGGAAGAAGASGRAQDAAPVGR